jgi:FkbM family methyltransferase
MYDNEFHWESNSARHRMSLHPMMGERLKHVVRGGLGRTSWGRRRLEARRRRLEASQRTQGAALYGTFLEPDDLCFDIGANIGNRTELLRDLGARVIAVEPQQPCVEELQRRFGTDPTVVVVGAAVGSEPGAAQIAVCEEDPTISTMSDRWQNDGRFADRTWASREEVQVTTLDELIAEHGMPAFCKIDVEGFERQVLEGLSSPVPCISFEFTREFLDDARACVSLLEGLGDIAVSVSYGDTMRLGDWTNPTRLFSEIASETNLDWGDIYVRSTGFRDR